MNFFKKLFHYLDHKEKELLGVNNAAIVYHAWKSWRNRSDTSEEYPPKIARTPYGTDVFNPIKIAQTPVQPISEMKIARTPGKVEVLPPPAQVFPIQNTTPTHVIDVQPEKQEIITKESSDKDKDFF
jgi:hypothetical protein